MFPENFLGGYAFYDITLQGNVCNLNIRKDLKGFNKRGIHDQGDF